MNQKKINSSTVLASLIKFLVSSILVLFAGLRIASAQEKEALKPAPIDVTGQVYMNWHTHLTDNSGKTGTKDSNTNTFEFERIYLNFQKKFDDTFSARVTLDMANDQISEQTTKSDGSTSSENTSKYRVFIKFAYLQAKNSFGIVDTILKIGMIDTPVTGFIDWLSDQRYVHKNLVDDAKNLLPGSTSIDNTADMGLSLALNFIKKADLILAITNGEGFKKTNESYYNNSNGSGDNSKNTSQGKAYYSRLTITPIDSLYISGFFRYEGTSVDESDNHKGYYGAGVAWKNELLKAGVNYILPFQKINGEDVTYSNTDKKKMSLLEAWITFTPKKLIEIPVVAMARYGYGDDFDQDNYKTTYMGIGLGYEFNTNIRAAAWYDQYDSEARNTANNPNPVKMFSVRADIKL